MLDSLFKKVAGLPATLLKRDSNTCVSCEYCEIFKNSFFTEHLRWLLLIVRKMHRVIINEGGLYNIFLRMNPASYAEVHNESTLSCQYKSDCSLKERNVKKKIAASYWNILS